MSISVVTIFVLLTCILTTDADSPHIHPFELLDEHLVLLQISSQAAIKPAIKKTAPHDAGTEATPMSQFETANVLKSVPETPDVNLYDLTPIALADTFNQGQNDGVGEDAIAPGPAGVLQDAQKKTQQAPQQQHIVGTGIQGAAEEEILQQEVKLEQQHQKLWEQQLPLKKQLGVQRQQGATDVAASPMVVDSVQEEAPYFESQPTNVDYGVSEKEQIFANNINNRLQIDIGHQPYMADNDAGMQVMNSDTLDFSNPQMKLSQQFQNSQPSSIEGIVADDSSTVKEEYPSILQREHQEFAPIHEHCMPQCSYNCSSPTCNEECHPVCQSPTCQTRCKGPDVSACRMNCGKPHCSVICPEQSCTDKNCLKCITNCSKPMCMLQCPKSQPCENVCEHPQCTFQCKAPTSCPQPTCVMQCESPKNCMGSMYRQLPPLRPGELLVQSFAAPSDFSIQNLEQHFASTSENSNFVDGMQPKSSSSVLGSSLTRQYASVAWRPTMVVPVEGVPAQNKAGMLIGPRSHQFQWKVQMPVKLNQEDPKILNQQTNPIWISNAQS